MHCELLFAAALLATGQAVEAAKPPQTQAAPAENLQLQYARAKLGLAQTNLRRVVQMNRRLKRSVPSSVVAEFQDDVDEANLQVEHAAAAPEGGAFDVWLRRAQSELDAATTRWKKAVAGNRRLKGMFQELDVERFRLRARVARLQWEHGKELTGAPRAAQLEWQVELLNNEVDRLKEERTRVAPFVRYYPVYWWY